MQPPAALADLGLSPRVRGNLTWIIVDFGDKRSIPACAGEPSSDSRHHGVSKVYPRVCGGTYYRAGVAIRCQGLSPRVRGNPPVMVALGLPERSIPACAGEPQLSPHQPQSQGVYPRVCGGTVARLSSHRIVSGLSPRVRGNQGKETYVDPISRSIPACAGEPTCRRTRRSPPWVYPRVCGGTAWQPRPVQLDGGLSPRVRGNHELLRRHLWRRRSIPACAGEPSASPPTSPGGWVYPRVCGGTKGAVEVIYYGSSVCGGDPQL